MSAGRRRGAGAAPAPGREPSLPATPAPSPAGFFDRHATALVLGLAAGHAALYSTLCAHKYRHYLYTDFDFAIFAQATDQLLRGSLFDSIRGMPWLGDHSSLILFLVAPFYALLRHPVALLVVQSVALALGALPAAWLARRESGSAAAAVGFAALYLLYPAVGYANLFEFHPETLATPLLLLAFHDLRARRPGRMTLAAGLALLAREDVALVVLGMAFYALATVGGRRRRDAVVLAVMAVASLLVTFAVLRPLLGIGQAEYGRMYGTWGATPGAALAKLAREPLHALASLFGTPGDTLDTRLKREYFVHLMAPLSFLPLLAPGAALIASPVVLEHLLSSRLAQHTIVFQYTALVAPFLVASAALGYGALVRRVARGARAQALAARLVVPLLVVSLACNALFGPLLGSGRLQGMARPEALAPSEYDRTLEPWRDALVARIPDRGGVVAGMEFLARFTDRAEVHALHHLIGGRYTYSTLAYPVPLGVAAVLADLGSGGLFHLVDAGTSARWRELQRRNHLRPVDAADDVVLFLRDAPDSIELCAPGPCLRERARRVVYDGELAFLGAEMGGPAAPGERVTFRTCWRRIAPADRFFLTEFVVVDTASRPVLQLWRYLGYTLHPVAGWPADTTMRETYRLALPHGLAPGGYYVGMRLWGRGARQAICEADDPAVRANEGFVSLGRFEVLPPRARRR